MVALALGCCGPVAHSAWCDSTSAIASSRSATTWCAWPLGAMTPVPPRSWSERSETPPALARERLPVSTIDVPSTITSVPAQCISMVASAFQ